MRPPPPPLSLLSLLLLLGGHGTAAPPAGRPGPGRRPPQRGGGPRGAARGAGVRGEPRVEAELARGRRGCGAWAGRRGIARSPRRGAPPGDPAAGHRSDAGDAAPVPAGLGPHGGPSSPAPAPPLPAAECGRAPRAARRERRERVRGSGEAACAGRGLRILARLTAAPASPGLSSQRGPGSLPSLQLRAAQVPAGWKCDSVRLGLGVFESPDAAFPRIGQVGRGCSTQGSTRKCPEPRSCWCWRRGVQGKTLNPSSAPVQTAPSLASSFPRTLTART